MPDILIRMEMPKSCADCHDADLPTAIAWLEAKCPCAYGMNKQGVYDLRHKRHPDCPLVELPPHGDLIERDAVKYTYAFHTDVLMTSNKILDKLPTIVGADKELLDKAHKEFIEEASKNRAVKYEQEVKSMRDYALELRDEARKIKNGNVPFPERNGEL